MSNPIWATGRLMFEVSRDLSTVIEVNPALGRGGSETYLFNFVYRVRRRKILSRKLFSWENPIQTTFQVLG